jgi:hypothetical protein
MWEPNGVPCDIDRSKINVDGVENVDGCACGGWWSEDAGRLGFEAEACRDSEACKDGLEVDGLREESESL